MSLDSSPITAASLAKPYRIKAAQFERAYKDHLSGFRDWAEAEHAEEWLIFPENIGPRVSIDETSMTMGEIYTIVANKDGHCRKGSLIAVIKGTRIEDVCEALMRIDEAVRAKVEEITMDFSESMRAIARICFPEARAIADRFHAQQMACDAMQETRMDAKRAAAKEEAQARKEHKKRLARNSRRRKKSKDGNRGRKPSRKNEAYRPFRHPNGDTRVELLTRSRWLLTVSPEKWTESQQERAAILFNEYPRLKEAYALAHSLRARYGKRHPDIICAGESMRGWIKLARESSLESFRTVADTIESRFEDVLGYFVSRATNAYAESLNAKIKDFRARLKGVSDVKFFLYRLSLIFG